VCLKENTRVGVCLKENARVGVCLKENASHRGVCLKENASHRGVGRCFVMGGSSNAWLLGGG
jgi:hypothetical protein